MSSIYLEKLSIFGPPIMNRVLTYFVVCGFLLWICEREGMQVSKNSKCMRVKRQVNMRVGCGVMLS